MLVTFAWLTEQPRKPAETTRRKVFIFMLALRKLRVQNRYRREMNHRQLCSKISRFFQLAWASLFVRVLLLSQVSVIPSSLAFQFGTEGDSELDQGSCRAFLAMSM